MRWLALSAICVMTSTGTQAQKLPPGLFAVTASERLTKVDIEAAQAMSKNSGITLTEATDRIQQMNLASRVAQMLRISHPDTFSSMSTTYVGSKLHFVVRLTDGNAAALQGALQTLSETRNAGLFSIEHGIRSEAQRDKFSQDLYSRLRGAGIDGVVSVDTVTDKITLLVRDEKATRRAIADGRFSVPTDTDVVQSDGIILTASTTYWAGGDYLDTPTEACTMGFMAATYTSGTYHTGVTTAYHCYGYSGVKIYVYPWGTYSSPSPYYANMGITWFPYTTAQDIAFFEFSNHTTGKAKDCFFDGTSCVKLSGTQYDFAGLYVCKYGRTSGKTCGYVNASKTTDSYGTFSKADVSTAYPKMSIEGDSGGPVYNSGLAIGIVHGRDSAYNLYYSAVTTWSAVNKNYYFVGQGFWDGWVSPNKLRAE